MQVGSHQLLLLGTVQGQALRTQETAGCCGPRAKEGSDVPPFHTSFGGAWVRCLLTSEPQHLPL